MPPYLANEIRSREKSKLWFSMSNEFLRAYTIPLLPHHAATAAQPMMYEETPLQPVQEAIPLLTAPEITTNFERYYAPGKQEPGQVLPPKPANRPQKRKLDSIDGGNKFFIGRDPSYPEELNKLIKSLSCELCSVKMNSPKSARDHYESKSHDKKLTAWIAHNYPENPPAIKRFVHEAPEGVVNSDAQHCKLCDLKLTSLVHAKQHYSGRKHKLVASNISNPSGAGYYDAEGKWVRTGTKLTPVLENDGRFGIGVDFKATETVENPESSTNNQTDTKNPTTIAPRDESLCCQVCKISVTSAPQMKTHLEGARHRKNLARLSTEPNVDIVTSTNTNDTLLNVVKKSLTTASSKDDYSMYRTPSGSYYCQSCNMSMSSVVTLQQHIEGKKHTKIIADQKTKDAKLMKQKQN